MNTQVNKNDPTLDVERSICEQIVTSALAMGYHVTVHDEEEEVLTKSLDQAAIIDSMFGTEVDTLVFYTPEGAKAGHFLLVYGNDASEVIADYSANEKMTCLYADVAQHFPGVLVP